MKNEEQKSAFILRVEEIAKELSTLVGDEGGGSEKSCLLLVNEMPQGSTTTAQCTAIFGSGKGLIKSMAAFISSPDMAEAVALGAKLAALEKIVKN